MMALAGICQRFGQSGRGERHELVERIIKQLAKRTNGESPYEHTERNGPTTRH